MPKLNILQEGQFYTFRSYCEMPYEIDEILAEFGYALPVGACNSLSRVGNLIAYRIYGNK